MNINLNHPRMEKAVVEERLRVARVHLKYVIGLYKVQLKLGRHFLHEHPASAASWDTPEMKELLSQSGVHSVVGHMCCHGMRCPSDSPGSPSLLVRKPTRWASSAPELLRRLGRRCTNEGRSPSDPRWHQHAVLEGRAPGGENRTALAAVYPPRLCTAILRGIAAQKAREGEALPAAIARRWREGRAVYDLEGEKPEYKELAALAAGRAEFEEQEGVTSAVVSPDDLCVLTDSGNGTARLWSTETGDLLTAYDDSTAKHWSTETGERTTTFRGHEDDGTGFGRADTGTGFGRADPGTGCVPELDDAPAREWPSAQEGYGRYWDDISGAPLPSSLVAAARNEEIEFMESWGVWEVRPVEECVQRTGKKPIGGRWVDHNKGDAENPKVRSRYVAKDIAYWRDDSMFVDTPPLEAVRLLLSDLATRQRGGLQGSRRGSRKALLIDVRKAHLHAYVEEDIYVALPPERAQPGQCAKLRRSLYGTRAAPARWEALYTRVLVSFGFTRGVANACCFYHAGWDVRCVVHGDDFTFTGCDAELDKVQRAMEAEFLCKVEGRLGGGAADLQEARLLNRVIRWTPEGLRYEADPRHAEQLARDVALFGGEEKRPLTYPGFRREPDDEEAARPLGAEQAAAYRALAARANYLCMDRPDLGFAAKECCRRMSAPSTQDWAALERLARYLAHRPRAVYSYPWQDAGLGLAVYADTDFAGCILTRRSTSGGACMRGAHLLKHWSVTQKTIALSSGEAELAGIVKGAAEGLGLVAVARDLGLEASLRLYADSSAAIGICRRTGIGRVRHLATGQLWVQERVRSGDFELLKHPGAENPADILTKPVHGELLDRHMASLGLQWEAGRPASAPALDGFTWPESRAGPPTDPGVSGFGRASAGRNLLPTRSGMRQLALEAKGLR